MTANILPEQRIELQRIWNALLRLALSRGVPFQDAEDLVSGVLRNALEHHDSARGELLPYCRTILYNAIKNFWRDRKLDLPFDDEQWSHPDGGPDLVLEEKERIESMKRTVDQLASLLSEKELAFMRMLGQVVDELGDRAVSETARRLGLKPEKGWDLFRRIQRKAHSLEAPSQMPILKRLREQAPAEKVEKRRPEVQATVTQAPAPYSSDRAPRTPLMVLKVGALPEPDPLFSVAGAMASEEGFERFMKNIIYPISDI